VGRISTAPDLVRGSVGGGVSFDSFMSLLYPMLPAGDGIGYVTSGVGSLLLARTLRGTDYTNTGLSSETLRRVLYVFANDLVQSPYQVSRHCCSFELYYVTFYRCSNTVATSSERMPIRGSCVAHCCW
jgi:hypothetical protein